MSDDITSVTPEATASAGTSAESTADSGTTEREYYDPNKHIPKSEFTKIRQRDAEERQRFETDFHSRQQQLATREQQLIQAAMQLQQRMVQGQHPGKDPYGKLREQPYITGQDLVEILEQLKQNDIGGINGELRKRDQALGLLYKQLTETRKALDSIQGRNAEGEFDGRLRTVQKELGLPDAPWALEFLKDVYLSHEGNDLNDEFPTLARTRLEELRKAIRSMDKEQAVKARQSPILPSGGQATPGKAVKDDGYKPPKQRAEELFEAFLGQGQGD